jgi:hypothetical protein
LSYTRISEEVGTVNEAGSTSSATEGNLFRYDPSASRYIFNWSTKGLLAGTYELWIDLGDEVFRAVRLGLR